MSHSDLMRCFIRTHLTDQGVAHWVLMAQLPLQGGIDALFVPPRRFSENPSAFSSFGLSLFVPGALGIIDGRSDQARISLGLQAHQQSVAVVQPPRQHAPTTYRDTCLPKYVVPDTVRRVVKCHVQHQLL